MQYFLYLIRKIPENSGTYGQWLEPDKTYLVTLPEFGSYAHTHDNTYQESLKNATVY